MRLRIATWNINSVRLRHEQVARFVAEAQPDVVCLQETKCREGEFPTQAFVDMGLPHIRIAGQKGWHGVAIASRLPIAPAPDLDLCREGHARCASGLIAGGDTPDRALNPKFDHKLDFYERLTRAMATRDPKAPMLIAGDLNIAPGEHDVWNHRHMSKIVSHTPIEVETFGRLLASLDLTDLVRAAVPEPQKLFSWWSYRAHDFRISNRGLRLDHLLASPGLTAAAKRDGAVAARVHDHVREWERPSDHVPVAVDLDV